MPESRSGCRTPTLPQAWKRETGARTPQRSTPSGDTQERTPSSHCSSARTLGVSTRRRALGPSGVRTSLPRIQPSGSPGVLWLHRRLESPPAGVHAPFSGVPGCASAQGAEPGPWPSGERRVNVPRRFHIGPPVTRARPARGRRNDAPVVWLAQLRSWSTDCGRVLSGLPILLGPRRRETEEPEDLAQGPAVDDDPHVSAEVRKARRPRRHSLRWSSWTRPWIHWPGVNERSIIRDGAPLSREAPWASSVVSAPFSA